MQELVDLFDQKESTISKATVDLAFERICNRRNNTHFDSYFNRLENTFSETDYALALKALNLIAEKNEVSKEDLYDHLKNDSTKRDLNAVIESLEYDGYINLRNNSYTFNSPILQLWWNKYVR